MTLAATEITTADATAAGIATTDYRLADFKLLIPLGPAVTVMSEYATCWWFANHLALDVGKVVVICNTTEQITAVEAMGENAEGHLQVPDNLTVDVLITMSDQYYDHVREGGAVLRVSSGEAVNAPPSYKFEHLGSWSAAPSWPEFRYLVPVSATGGRQARNEFRLPYDAQATLLRVYRRKGLAPAVTLQEQIRSTLRQSVDPDIGMETHWTIFSGQQGEGNPIVCFATDQSGDCRYVVKTSRYAGQTHLIDEQRQIETVQAMLGSTLSERIIAPVTSLGLGERTMLAYRFVHTHPFYGLRWRLANRTCYLATLSTWLSEVAVQTAHTLPAADFARQHLAPLQRLTDSKRLPDWLHDSARRAIDELSELSDTPLSILEHGDLGCYNTRMTASDGSDFKVLDWGSATTDGAPLGDLCYALAVSNAPKRTARRLIEHYLDTVGYPREFALTLWLAYMGRRWEELDKIRGIRATDAFSGGGVLLHTTSRICQFLGIETDRNPPSRLKRLLGSAKHRPSLA